MVTKGDTRNLEYISRANCFRFQDVGPRSYVFNPLPS